MLEDERHLARTHFKYGPRALPAGASIAEARIEKACIMHAEFADQRIERHHLCGIVRRHLHRLFRSQDVELAGIENERAIAPYRNGLPEFADRIAGAAVDIDHPGMTLGAVAHEPIGVFA